ncbi:MAG: carboxypeptidase-like regulatory domain-containing protein [Fimbriimonadales bacterium]|nr:carboxypeptidase-like regulatory domain-containing protein [Fimbriimonadales bacterium]
MQQKRCAYSGLFALCTLSVVMLLTACGGGGESGGTNPPPGEQTLQGRLTRADNPNAGLAGAQVALYQRSRSAGGAPVKTVNTDGDGNYQFVGIPAGDYLLVAEMPDGSYQPIELPVTVRQPTTLDLSVIPAGVQIGNIEITLPATNGPDYSYLIGREYQFTARVFDISGRELTGWQPNWSITNGVGSINRLGRFTAASVGDGEVVAYFHVGAQRIQFRKPIRVREPQENLTAPWLLVPVRLTASNYGLRAYDTRTKQIRQDNPLNAASSGYLSFARGDVLYYLNSNGQAVYRVVLSSGQVTSFSPERTVNSILALPDERLILRDSVPNSADGFYLYDGRTGQRLSDRQRIDVSDVNGWALGPDGKIYIGGRYRDAGRLVKGVVRFRLEGSRLVFDKAVLSGTGDIYGVAFAANGDMIVVEERALRRYTSEGAPLTGGFSLPGNERPEAIRIGRGVLQPNDEVLFVLTDQGIWRVNYNGASFSLIPADANKHFLRGNFRDCAVWNRQ